MKKRVKEKERERKREGRNRKSYIQSRVTMKQMMNDDELMKKKI
jgi:hypothetical protein